ncbi:hypothetical protein CHN50_00135 [Priestia aryabhattai]|uniref:DUF1273 domain-containing protein n=1 Tax=Bacillaceae TaxID=186817 RepID=UPI000BA12E02|nr:MULTISPECIES: DUF1273 domain-containing protein [Bacillaceae]MDT2047414.1 DUF1273 domain-containing protein [Priestia flexa]OZT14036.1 hypothetical protein CHN50_00135 [Priestia aryabhattai]TDB55158.1 DUF1273 domain-containing protein [Bacillus sp. CBEL-1]USY56462.1 DUF1273 domain-containing protein [Bacillus sp. 1780r2a1]
MKVLTISGYKPFELGIFNDQHPGISYIKKAIMKRLVPLIEEGLEWVLISGQLGVELWAAEVVFDLQLEYPQLQLGVLTPFLDQEEKWNEANKELYEFILSQADFVDSITKKKYESPNQFRLKNQFLIEKSDGICIVYDEEHEGSPKFMLKVAQDKAEKSDYPIITITSYDLQDIVEEEKFSSF